jgi:hypothetical protein
MEKSKWVAFNMSSPSGCWIFLSKKADQNAHSVHWTTHGPYQKKNKVEFTLETMRCSNQSDPKTDDDAASDNNNNLRVFLSKQIMVDYMKRTRIKAQTKQWWKRMKKQVDDKKT